MALYIETALGRRFETKFANNPSMNSNVSPFPSALIVVRPGCAVLEAWLDSHHPCGNSMYQLKELQGEGEHHWYRRF